MPKYQFQIAKHYTLQLLIYRTLAADDMNTAKSEEHTHTVLIIDDNAEDRFLLKRYLQKTNLSLLVLEAKNGQEGIDLLTKPSEELLAEYPSLSAPITLFLDINMPIMNGWEFVEALKIYEKEISVKPTVVMMFSTSDDDYEMSKVEKYQTIAGYIVKGDSNPIDLKQAILDATAFTDQ